VLQYLCSRPPCLCRRPPYESIHMCTFSLSLNTFSHLSLLSVRAREGRVSEGRSLLEAGIEHGEGT
jgi:hypothetical protein